MLLLKYLNIASSVRPRAKSFNYFRKAKCVKLGSFLGIRLHKFMRESNELQVQKDRNVLDFDGQICRSYKSTSKKPIPP